MSDWGEAEARGFLQAHGFGSGPFGIRHLAGGLWNDVLQVTSATGTYILKHYVTVLPGTLFPNLPDAEAMALQRLAGLNVAPTFVGFWPEASVLLYDYVPGALWQDDVTAVAELLRRKEAADPTGFRPLAIMPEAILAQADTLFARCTETELVRSWRNRRPVSFAIAPPSRLSLVHTDIGAGNLVGVGAGLRLIDWQCPGAGDLAEDLFSFLSPAFHVLNHRTPLQFDQKRTFLAVLALPDVVGRYALLRPFYAYRMAAYCCLRLQTAPEVEIRQRYSTAALAELSALASPR